MNEEPYKFKVYLGKLKDTKPTEYVYLNGFTWSCGWYWGGGYITTKHMHTHFDSCFLDPVDPRGHSLGNFVSPWTKMEENSKEVSNGCSIWEDLDFFLDDAQFTADEWWRIKDLYKQFYILQDCAEIFQYGGNCTSKKRQPEEIDKEKAKMINSHIESVIIPEIIKALKIKTL